MGRDLVEQKGQHAFPPISPFTQQGRAITSALAPCSIPHANPAKQDVFAKKDKIQQQLSPIQNYKFINTTL